MGAILPATRLYYVFSIAKTLVDHPAHSVLDYLATDASICGPGGVAKHVAPMAQTELKALFPDLLYKQHFLHAANYGGICLNLHPT